MNRDSRPQDLEFQRSSHSRSRSTSSFDYPLSTNGSTYSFINPLLDASPEPAFIAPAAATGIVTSNHGGFLYEEGLVISGTPTIPVTAPALRLINQFLDFLLYSFLSTAKSTSLSALRPAVTQVLKARFAKEAITGADEELQSYLGGSEGDEIDGYRNDNDLGEWDLVRAWKRTRIRCMVYSSLGDLEEDDEVAYSEFDLEGTVGGQQYNRNSFVTGVVTPAVAIWLTAILEFVGEQTLLVAGHATISRFSAVHSVALADGGEIAERPMVEESDTEKVALNPSLGRMWRQWRKLLRGTNGSISFSVERRLSTSSRRSQRTYDGNDEGKENIKLILPSTDELDRTKESPAQAEEPAPAEALEIVKPTMNPLTPIWEAMPNMDPEMVKEDAADNSPTNLHLESTDGRRPRSMTLPSRLTSSSFETTKDSSMRGRSQSLPPSEKTKAPFSRPTTSYSVVPSQEHDGEVDKDLDSDWDEPHIANGSAVSIIDTSCCTPKLVELTEIRSRQQSLSAPVPALEPVTGSARSSKSIPRALEEEEIGLARTSNYLVSPGETETGNGDLPRNREHAKSQHQHPPRKDSKTPSPDVLKEAQELVDSSALPANQRTLLAEGPYRRDGIILDTVTSSDEEHLGSRGNIPTMKGSHSPAVSTSPKSGSPMSSHSKSHSTSSTGNPERRKVPYNTGQTSPLERPTVVRTWTPPGSPYKSRRSESFSRNTPRPIHTSGSSTSQGSQKLKTIMTWPAENSKRTHDSDDSSSVRSEKYANRLAKMDDKERSFEELIQSGGTILCTITPDPIRSIRVPESSTSQSDDRSSVTKVTNITTSMTANKVPVATARDARIDDTSSARDLALFLRSTGPPEAPVNVPRTTSSHSTTTNSNSNSTSNSKAQKLLESSTASIKSVTRPSGKPSPTNIQPIPNVMTLQRNDSKAASMNRKRFLAREASGSTGDSTSALADFFRNTTPPVDGEQVVTHRISRSVAPFRNTMDSVQFDIARDPARAEPNGSPKEPAFSDPPASYQSSMTSSTGLLKSTPKRNEEFTKKIAESYKPSADSSPFGGAGGPVRKQRRVMDPYAIDIEDEIDSEDLDDLDLILPHPSRRRDEESLIDFLNNAPPPPPQPLKPFVETAPKKVQKKNSAVSLITRFGRAPTRKNSLVSPIERPSTVSSFNLGPHKPIIIETKEDDSSSIRPYENQSSAASIISNSNTLGLPSRTGGTGGSKPSLARQMHQARGARVQRDDTTDSLADFLKYTPPPPTSAPQPFITSSSASQKEDSSLTKLKNITLMRRSKRKEVAGVVY